MLVIVVVLLVSVLWTRLWVSDLSTAIFPTSSLSVLSKASFCVIDIIVLFTSLLISVLLPLSPLSPGVNGGSVSMLPLSEPIGWENVESYELLHEVLIVVVADCGVGGSVRLMGFSSLVVFARCNWNFGRSRSVLLPDCLRLASPKLFTFCWTIPGGITAK